MLWIVDSNGGKARQITTGYTVNAPSWSPDGKRIAFVGDAYAKDSRSSFGMAVYTIRPDGSDLTRLTSSDVYEQQPVWSRDGSQIAFRRSPESEDNLWDLWVMNADGSDQRGLTRWPGSVEDPTWSADGSAILVANSKRDGDPATEIYAVAVDGSGAELVFDVGAQASLRGWRP